MVLKKGEITLEEFRRKWRRKGDWKNYVRVMRHRIRKKVEEAKEEIIVKCITI